MLKFARLNHPRSGKILRILVGVWFVLALLLAGTVLLQRGAVQRIKRRIGAAALDLQAIGDDDLGLTVLLGDCRALQHVFGHGDGFTKVFLAATAVEDVAEEV